MLLKINQPIPDNLYDVVVIGSGLGGMTAANVLAKSGAKVLLLEAHNKCGGFATWFYREQRELVFDISLHGFPHGMIKTCRKYWGKDIADHIRQLKDVRFDNPQFQLQTEFTKEHFTHLLIHHFQISPEKVKAFFDHLAAMNFYDQNHQTNHELFEEFFPGRNDVVRLLMEPITYANGSTLDDPAISYGIVFSNFMSKGVYTFQGGTDFIIQLMQERLLENGVDLKLQTKATQIVLSPIDSSVKGVWVQTGKQAPQFIQSKTILSNAHLLATLNTLVGEKNLPVSLFEEAQPIRVNSSSCQVYIGFKPGTDLPNMGELLFTSTYPTYDAQRLLDLKVTSRTFSVYRPEIVRPQDPTARPVIVSSTNVNYESWKKLSPDDYQKEKDFMIEETLIGLEKYFPEARKYITHIEAATPLTVERFTHHPQGASFGTKFEGLPLSMNLHRHIPGLYHAGSVGIIMSGWLGAANYGVIQANNILSDLYQKSLSTTLLDKGQSHDNQTL